jgi:hypothetical protein
MKPPPMDIRSIWYPLHLPSGTPLNVGSKVEFHVTVSDSMTIAKSGVILFLCFRTKGTVTLREVVAEGSVSMSDEFVMRDQFDRWERVWHQGQYDLIHS